MHTHVQCHSHFGQILGMYDHVPQMQVAGILSLAQLPRLRRSVRPELHLSTTRTSPQRSNGALVIQDQQVGRDVARTKIACSVPGRESAEASPSGYDGERVRSHRAKIVNLRQPNSDRLSTQIVNFTMNCRIATHIATRVARLSVGITKRRHNSCLGMLAHRRLQPKENACPIF